MRYSKIVYPIYCMCAHTAQRGFVCTQKEAVWLTVASPDVDHVPLRQQRPRACGALSAGYSVCVAALCTELYLCIEFYLFLSPLYSSNMTFLTNTALILLAVNCCRCDTCSHQWIFSTPCTVFCQCIISSSACQSFVPVLSCQTPFHCMFSTMI